ANGYHTLIHDPLLNYPYGAVNPNPPLYQWTVAVGGHLLAPLFSAHPEMGLSQEQYATWWVTEWAPAVFGSLTLIPIYFMGAALRERRLGFGYALLTGMSIAAVALMWKGFPYIVGTMFAYAGLQMIIDHWRNRDSTGLFLATLIAMLVGTIVAYPYYAQAHI